MTISSHPDAAAILRHVTQRVFRHLHGRKAVCPEDRIPTPEKLADWLPDCPEKNRQESARRVAEMVDPPEKPPEKPPENLLEKLSEKPLTLRSPQPVEDMAVLSAAHWWRTLMDRPRSRIASTGGSPAVILHDAWAARPGAQRSRHFLAPLAAAWLEQPVRVLPERRHDRRILPVVGAVEREAILPSLDRHYPAERPSTLPLFPDRRHRVPLLDLVDASGVPVLARGRGAPLPMRLFVGLLLAVRREDRYRQSVRVAIPMPELLKTLFPGGSFRAGRHWEKLRKVMRELPAYALSITDRKGSEYWWLPVAMRQIPKHPDRGKEVVFDIAYPPGVVDGPTVDLAKLNDLSMISAPRWRAAIAGHSLAWRPGTTRRPVPGRKGRWGWAKDPEAYPVLSLEDRRRLAFGWQDTKHRTRREIDAAWSDLPGLVVVEKSAKDPKTGAMGWRLVPAEDRRATGENRRATGENRRATGENRRATGENRRATGENFSRNPFRINKT